MDKIKYTTYLAGAIEADSKSAGWRNSIKEMIKDLPILVYDPVEQESYKVGRKAQDQIKYITGLKKGGHWNIFTREMNRIWLGSLTPTHDLIEIFKILRYRKIIDGNKKEELQFWGDYEAVVRSDFIVAYIKKDIQTIGTIAEIFLAMLFKIPVYLIIDAPKTDTNSSLLYFVLYSGGEVFYTINDCIAFLKQKYNQ
ncbi:MAG: hypothetical protein ACTSYR_02115 [Candidatus Odinarchaeia archaeon]